MQLEGILTEFGDVPGCRARRLRAASRAVALAAGHDLEQLLEC